MNELVNLLLNKVIYLSTRIVPVIVISIILANIIAEFKLVNKLERVFKPIFNFSNLSPDISVPTTLYLVSYSAGSSALSNLIERKAVSEKEALVAYFVGGLFTFVNHAIIYYIPILIPLLGVAGLLYIFVRFVINFLIAILAAIYGHFYLKQNLQGSSDVLNDRKKMDKLDKSKIKNTIKKAINKSKKIILKIIVRMYLVYVPVSLATYFGLFNVIACSVKSVINIVNLPGEISVIIAVGLVDPISSYVVAASLLNDCVLSEIETVLALLLSSLFTMTASVFRHSLPSKITYFGVKLGTKIAFYSFILNLVFILLSILVLLMFVI